jgi:signal transduction histidine kinase/CheY-like chemotaxis protein
MKNKSMIFLSIIMFAILVGLTTIHTNNVIKSEEQSLALNESTILKDHMLIQRKYYQNLIENNTLLLDKKTSKELASVIEYGREMAFKSINSSGISIQIVSKNDNNNQADTEELKGIEFFKTHKTAKEYFNYIEKKNDSYYQYAYPLYVSKDSQLNSIISIKIPRKHTLDYTKERLKTSIALQISTLMIILLGSIIFIVKNAKKLEKLEKEKDKANLANNLKTEFLANMSHEIRTPLNAILGFTELLEESETNNNKLKYLKTINSSSHTLLGVINDILDFSKIERNKCQTESLEFNPKLEFIDTIALHYAKAVEKNVNLIVYIDPNMTTVLNSDSMRLKQVINNLIGNALKFSKAEDEVKLTIKNHGSVNNIRFCVIDNGIGISETYQQNIFEAFTREESSTRREYGGTGLGLTISFKLLELLGSKLKLKSTLGIGSTFYFDINVDNYLYDKAEDNRIINNAVFRNKKTAVLFSKKNKSNSEVINLYLNSLEISNIYNYESIDLNILKDFDLVILNYCLYDYGKIEDILSRNQYLLIIKPLSKNVNFDAVNENIIELNNPITSSELYNLYMELFLHNENGDIKKEITIEKDIKLEGKILLVEDNKSNQLFIKAILKKLGLSFDVANDGLEAMDNFKKNKYYLILMDENMPNMGGIETTKNILEYEKENNVEHTIIIALTANDLDGDKEKFITAGMDEYLTKPLDKRKLTLMMKGFLGESID